MPGMEAWHIKGELALSCSCTVFCPCVISLGKHPPTESQCQTWAGIRIDDGRHGDVDLSQINLVVMIEIPGLMSRGNWVAGLFIDNKASVYQVKALTRIMTGQARGSTHLLSILVSRFLGVWQEDVRYETEGEVRRINVPKIIEGEIRPIAGKDKSRPTMIENSQYWIAPQVIVSEAVKSRFRHHGRNWDFQGRSAEICALNWKGP
jgi:hypothetical protein